MNEMSKGEGTRTVGELRSGAVTCVPHLTSLPLYLVDAVRLATWFTRDEQNEIIQELEQRRMYNDSNYEQQ